MKVTIENSQIAMRACIFYEVKLGRGIDEAYQNFCKVMGNDVMEYTEFDYWFYRFYNGHRDLNHERGLDPVPCTFFDMSNNVIEKVLDRLDFFERLPLRKVCHVLRDIWSPGEKEIIFAHSNEIIRLHIGGKIIEYKQMENNCQIKTVEDEEKKEEIVLESKNFMEMALNTLFFVLKLPKLELERFDFVVRDHEMIAHYVKYLKFYLNFFTHKLHIRALECQTRLLSNLLPHVKPGILEAIKLEDTEKDVFVEDDVFNLDQWKQAKVLEIFTPFFAPIENFSHFTRLELHWQIKTADEVLPIQNILQKCSNLQTCVLYFNENNDDAVEVADVWKTIDLTGPGYKDNDDIRIYLVPDCNKLFKITYDGEHSESFCFERIC